MIIMLLLFVFLVPAIYGMDSHQDVDKPCLLAVMPADIKNLIAQFLTFKDRETQQEFIERTKQPKKVPDECLAKFALSNTIRRQFCPNHTKAVVKVRAWQRGDDGDFDVRTIDELTILDLVTQQRRTIDLFKKCGSFESPVALSPDGTLIATIITKRVPDGDKMRGQRGTERMYWKDQHELVTHNIINDEHKEVSIVHSDNVQAIDFNKEGNKIIVHENEEKYTIFPLNENASQIKREKKLEDYLLQFGICKDLNSSRNLKRSNS